jgi:hypothetical protein
VLGFIHHHYASRGVFGLFTVCSSEPCARVGLY